MTTTTTINEIIAAGLMLVMGSTWVCIVINAHLRRKAKETEQRVLDAIDALECVLGVAGYGASYAQKALPLWPRASELYAEWLSTEAGATYAASSDARSMFFLFLLDHKNIDLADPDLPERENWDVEDHPIQARLRAEVMREAGELCLRELSNNPHTWCSGIAAMPSSDEAEDEEYYF